MTGITLRRHHPESLAMHCTFEAFTAALGGPSEIVIEGEDNSKTRVVVTLLHGNEPSGLKAIYRYIRGEILPSTRCVFIIGSVTAALTPPLFFYRMLPGQADLNRCFSTPPHNLQGALATAIKNRIADWSPESVVDIHNTSGSGPAFCVITQQNSSYIALASYFGQRIIVTDISLGSLMEQDFACPVVTVEAGGSQDNYADETAYTGLLNFLSSPTIEEPLNDVELLNQPRRLELKKPATIVYAQEQDASASLTLRSDIEHLNFGVTPANTELGWLSVPLSKALRLDRNQEYLSDCFIEKDNKLLTAKPLRLFMVTTRADIAASDCLFYFQHDFC